MKKGISLLTCCALMLSLVSCGDAEEEIVYEESLHPLVPTYTLETGETAPAFYSNVFSYITANSIVELTEIMEPGEVVVEVDTETMSKDEIKAYEAEQDRLEAARELKQLERDREMAKLGSVRMVSFFDASIPNAERVAAATEAHEAELALIAEAEAVNGPSEENLSNTEGEEGGTSSSAAEVEDLSYLDDIVYDPYVYTYDISTTGKTGNQAAQEYIVYLQSSGYKVVDIFHPVNGEHYEMMDPDFTQRAGTAALAKKGSGVDKLAILIVDWHYNGVVVTMYQEDGTLWIAPKVEAKPDTLTVSDAKNFLESRHPSQLGLEGDSMMDYFVLSSEALVYINSVAYREFSVVGPTGDFGGNFLIDSDGNTFRFNKMAGTIEPLTTVPNIFDTL